LKLLTATTLFLVAFFVKTNAQSCGFGCLGMSGFYGGYAMQRYNADNFNATIANTFFNGTIKANELSEKFGQAQGYRLGANIFRAKFNGLFISAKAFYQLLNEEHTYFSPFVAGDKNVYKLNINYWGMGLDFGFHLTSIFYLKLVEGALTFYSTKLEINNYANGKLKISKYQNSKTDISYYVGSGLIIQVIPYYLSIEGTVFYTLFKIDNLENDKGIKVANLNGNKSLFSGNNLGAVVQVNIGLPY